MPSEFLDEREKKVLELAARKKLYFIIRKYAGCHFREIGRISGLPAGTVRYHLNYLARHGLIHEFREGNSLRYFQRDFCFGNKRLMGLLRQKSIRKILTLLLVGDCTHHDILSSLNLSASTVSWYLRKLEAGGVIAGSGVGRRTYSLLVSREEVISLLITYRESFLDSVVDRVVEMWDV